MKRILAIILSSITMFSCTPTSPDPPSTPQSTISFSANGTLITNSTSLASNYLKKIPATNSQVAGYALVSQNAGNYVISLFLLANSTITTTSYNTTRITYPSAEYTVFNFPGVNSDYANLITGDFMNVNITQIQNGLANGTFTAKMSRSTNNPTIVNITNGEFTNVPIQN
jgi:hypothetical protein